MIIGHEKQIEFLKKKFEHGQLSHAYLFTGQDEIGKKKCALEFVKTITGIDKETHPNLLLVEQEGEILIAKIREVQRFLSLKPYNSLFKTVIIDGAEKMNQEAQSCFLKTLEEPKGNTVLFLISSRPDMLLSTILSRCQTIKFFPVNKKEMEKHFGELAEIAKGKPGRAIKISKDSKVLEKDEKILKTLLTSCSGTLSERFQYLKNAPEESFSDILRVFKNYLREMLLSKIGVETKIVPNGRFSGMGIQKLKQIIHLQELIDFRLLTTNTNPKLALEILLMEI